MAGAGVWMYSFSRAVVSSHLTFNMLLMYLRYRIYWIGPIMGALIAAGYYRFCKYFNYEEANPDQDHAGADEIV